MYLPANSSTVGLARSIVPDVTKIYLSPSYDLTLALTSYLVSALGGYTATQLMTQVATTKKVWERVGWVALAGLVFGGW
jgi:NO-binding membrane sensor protein with MHYT domain